jgi:calcineurin-like phosphoesterase family protein
MSKVWHTSDLHISHSFVASTRTHWVGRPSDWMGATEWHDEYLAERWDSVVGKDDVVYVHGDICGGTDKSYIHALQWIQERPGRKVLIHGNHDPINGMHREATKWGDATREAFVSNHAYLRRRITLLEGGTQDVLLSHFPYTDRHIGIGREGRHQTYRLQDGGVPVIHGHTHSVHAVSYAYRMPTFGHPGDEGTLQLHVGVDAWKGSPVPLSWIQDEVRAWVGTIPPWERENGVQP